jgi:hypothetical protein
MCGENENFAPFFEAKTTKTRYTIQGKKRDQKTTNMRYTIQRKKRDQKTTKTRYTMQ